MEWEYLLSPRWRVLDRAARALAGAAPDAVDTLRRQAEEAWALLAGEHSRADLGRCCASVANRAFAGADPDRLRSNALRHFAAAAVAAHLRQPAGPGDLAALEVWLG